MWWIVFKYLVTAGLVVAISEVAKRSDKLGALIAALPMVSVLAMIWMYLETRSHETVGNHAWYTFWYVVPTLPMFLLFPFLLPRLGFAGTLLVSAAITMLCFWLLALAVKPLGIDLMP